MADEAGVNGGDQTVKIEGNEDAEDVFVDPDEGIPKASTLLEKIEALEQEKRELVHDNEVVIERINKLKSEIESLQKEKEALKNEIHQSESDKRALESIAPRAAELEIEVSRLQHDLITSLNDGKEANEEATQLRRRVEELQKSGSEKGLKLEALEKERNLLMEKLDQGDERMKTAKLETDVIVRLLEKKLEGLEGRESVEKSERIKIEQVLRAKIDEKDDEIRRLKNQIGDLGSVAANSRLEIEMMKKANDELEIVKNELEALLKKSERRGKEMENKLAELHKELEASVHMISGLKEKTLDGIYVKDRDGVDGGEKALYLQWPVLAASTGALAAVAVVCYLRCARQS